MAKRKIKTRRIFVKPKRKGGRKSGSKKVPMATLIGAMAYGALRAPVNNFVKSKVPAIGGELGDEIVMGALSFATANGMIPIVKGFKMSKDLGKAGLAVEGARIGEFLASKFMNNNTTNAPVGFGATLG